MATSRQEFIDLADELFEEFADFQQEGKFTRILTTNRNTGELNEGLPESDWLQKVDGIEISFNERIFDNSLAKVGDYIQIFRYKFFTWIPEIGKTSLSFGGIRTEMVNIKIDPAKATIFLHVRRM